MMTESKKEHVSKHLCLLQLRLEIGIFFVILLAKAGYKAKPRSGKSDWVTGRAQDTATWLRTWIQEGMEDGSR